MKQLLQEIINDEIEKTEKKRLELLDFIQSNGFKQISQREQRLLVKQEYVMRCYTDILEERLDYYYDA
jgi:hypothetical protein